MTEVVGHGQAFGPPAVGQTVADEVHAPHLVEAVRGLQRRALVDHSNGLLALAHRQSRGAVQPIDPLVVDAGELGAQQVVHPSIAKASSRMGDLDDLAHQPLRGRIGPWHVSVAAAWPTLLVWAFWVPWPL